MSMDVDSKGNETNALSVRDDNWKYQQCVYGR